MLKEINVPTYKPRFGKNYLSTIFLPSMQNFIYLMLRKNIFKVLSILALYFLSHLNDIIKDANKKQTKNQNKFKRFPEIIN